MFLDSKTFDGFRRCIDRQFDYVYIVDTQSDVRNNLKISGTSKILWIVMTQTGFSRTVWGST
jgi:predicted helicase